MRGQVRFLVGYLPLLAGCANWDTPLATLRQVPAPLSDQVVSASSPRDVNRANFAPAETTVGLRVDQVGTRLLNANVALGLRPMLHAVGSPTPQLFHQGTQHLYITEGLVKQCRGDQELAALLAREMGTMVAEREATQLTANPVREDPLPKRFPISGGGNDYVADPYHETELWRHGVRQKQRQASLKAPDANQIAARILHNAGYGAESLEIVLPMLDALRNDTGPRSHIHGIVVRPVPGEP